MVETITHNEQIYGIIISKDYTKEGIDFFTPDSFSQQMGYMNRPQGYIIAPHVHNLVTRKVELTQEVLIVKRGKIRVDFYDDMQAYLESRIITAGGIFFFSSCGVGFCIFGQAGIILGEQGPYFGGRGKICFPTVDRGKKIIKKENYY